MEAKKELNLEKKIYTAKEVIEIFNFILKKLKRKKGRYAFQKFTFEELCFLIELIFKKPKNLIFVYLADYLQKNTSFKNIPFSGLNIKRLQFFYNILLFHNAKKSAIMAGYSPRSAAQTGYRIVKAIQGYKRIGNSSRFIKKEKMD